MLGGQSFGVSVLALIRRNAPMRDVLDWWWYVTQKTRSFQLNQYLFLPTYPTANALVLRKDLLQVLKTTDNSQDLNLLLRNTIKNNVVHQQ